MVRTIAMGSSEGLKRGLAVEFLVQDATALDMQRVPELGERHPSARFVEERGPGGDLHDRIVAFREGGERDRRVEAWLEQEV